MFSFRILLKFTSRRRLCFPTSREPRCEVHRAFRSISIRRPTRVASYLRGSLRNLGWPLKGRFARDKKLNRRLRRVAPVIDRETTGGGGNFQWKTRRKDSNIRALQIVRQVVPRCNLQQGQQRTNRQFVCEYISLRLAKVDPTFPPRPSIITWCKISFLIGMIQTGSRRCLSFVDKRNERIDDL